VGRLAREHPDGLVDLSVGTPVDPTPEPVRRALSAAADAAGYPTTHGTPSLRAAAAEWLRRRLGVGTADPAAVLPVIGTKELIAWLPTLLGLGPGDVLAHPELSYPTYEVGARLCGATAIRADGLVTMGPRTPRLVWVNSPANPTGRVLPPEHLRKVVDWARDRGTLVVSDECYIELGWESDPVSILHPEISGGDHTGLLTVHSLSKRSNMAGYRAGFVTGDPALVRRLLEIRKHSGMMVPAPVQAAMTVALEDDRHVIEQRERYAARRARLKGALEHFGLRIDHSEAALYLWATRDEGCWDTVRRLAELGILAAPGDFYGAGGSRHVRVAITATDERVTAAVDRLRA
jgi:succinyldiaminopimelate transaminase